MKALWNMGLILHSSWERTYHTKSSVSFLYMRFQNLSYYCVYIFLELNLHHSMLIFHFCFASCAKEVVYPAKHTRVVAYIAMETQTVIAILVVGRIGVAWGKDPLRSISVRTLEVLVVIIVELGPVHHTCIWSKCMWHPRTDTHT